MPGLRPVVQVALDPAQLGGRGVDRDGAGPGQRLHPLGELPGPVRELEVGRAGQLMAHHPRRQPQAQTQQNGSLQGDRPERGRHRAVAQVGDAVGEAGHRGPAHRDQPAVGAEDQQARRGHRRGPGPRPEDQHQRGGGRGQVDEGRVEPVDGRDAEPVAGPEQLHGQPHDRDQEQPVGGGDPAATAVTPPGGQRPGQPRARRARPQQQPQAGHEQSPGLGQHRPVAPGSGTRVDEQVLDLAGVPVVVRPGQHEPEDGQPEHADGHQLDGQLRGQDDGQDREAELGRDKAVSPAGHHGGRHRDGQQQQTRAAGPDAPPQAIRPRARRPRPRQDERDAPDRQQQHQREQHDHRLPSVPVRLAPSWPSRRAAAMGLRPRTGVVLGPPWRENGAEVLEGGTVQPREIWGRPARRRLMPRWLGCYICESRCARYRSARSPR